MKLLTLLAILILIALHIYTNWEKHYRDFFPLTIRDKVKSKTEDLKSASKGVKKKAEDKMKERAAKKEHMKSFDEDAIKEDKAESEVKPEVK